MYHGLLPSYESNLRAQYVIVQDLMSTLFRVELLMGRVVASDMEKHKRDRAKVKLEAHQTTSKSKKSIGKVSKVWYQNNFKYIRRLTRKTYTRFTSILHAIASKFENCQKLPRRKRPRLLPRLQLSHPLNTTDNLPILQTIISR